MTKKLEELFDLPEGTNNDLHEPIVSGDKPELPKDTIKTLDKIDDALPRVQGLESSDTEMDDLAKAAKQSYEELMNLGMNVDSRFASEIGSSINYFFPYFWTQFCNCHVPFALILATLELPLGQLFAHILNQVDFDDHLHVLQIFEQGLKT